MKNHLFSKIALITLFCCFTAPTYPMFNYLKDIIWQDRSEFACAVQNDNLELALRIVGETYKDKELTSKYGKDFIQEIAPKIKDSGKLYKFLYEQKNDAYLKDIVEYDPAKDTVHSVIKIAEFNTAIKRVLNNNQWDDYKKLTMAQWQAVDKLNKIDEKNRRRLFFNADIGHIKNNITDYSEVIGNEKKSHVGIWESILYYAILHQNPKILKYIVQSCSVTPPIDFVLGVTETNMMFCSLQPYAEKMWQYCLKKHAQMIDISDTKTYPKLLEQIDVYSKINNGWNPIGKTITQHLNNVERKKRNTLLLLKIKEHIQNAQQGLEQRRQLQNNSLILLNKQKATDAYFKFKSN